jgi:hypothetical protein
MLAFLEDLTAIQPYSGWRNSATEGETEALDYVAKRLGEFAYLQELGLDVERQSFRVYNSTELWETRLLLTVGGEEIEVPADGVRGSRHDNYLAQRFDSDGAIKDTERDPVMAEGPVVLVRSYDETLALTPEDVEGKIIFLDYAVIDRFTQDPFEQTLPIAPDLLALKPSGVLMVTQFSNASGESHGTFVGDSNAFVQIPVSPEAPAVPILYATLEDMAVAGIEGWDDLARIESARLIWDADVLSPGTSGNVVAHIPGGDPSQAVILGAHIDSPNSPGALDDGSGAVILLEVARVLNEAQVQPPVDLVLAWFGSEEIGLYGSAHFVATHQELLDHTLAMLQIDMLSYPLEGLDFEITLHAWPYDRLGNDRMPWLDHIAQLAERRGLEIEAKSSYEFESDNVVFIGFDVPNANMSYQGPKAHQYSALHYPTHIHDPYDTVDLAREKGDVFEEMAQVALVAALETGLDAPDLRVPPEPARRAVFVASHTEALLMSPLSFVDLGQTLAMEGLDVDLIPYGHATTAEDLEDADLVVALPVIDLPGQGGDMTLYDEAWTEEEIAILERYVAEGGFLVLTNSENRLTLVNGRLDLNEDWRDVNALAERLGVHYQFGFLTEKMIWTVKQSHPLVERVSYVEQTPENGVPFKMEGGLILARQGAHTAIGLLDYGDAGGQVLVLADVGMLGNGGLGTPDNLRFWQNLAQYARSR